MTRILVTGSRDWEDEQAVYRMLFKACRDLGQFTLVHGDCPTGADKMADTWGAIQYFDVERHPADWKRYGRRAGFIRNDEMVQLGADRCIAFIRNGSRGASMTARIAEDAGIPTFRIEINDKEV